MTNAFNEIVKPFWVENSGFIGGRDALGIQNSSITVYGKLLPGLTNLTERLRYYSFYCWLLSKYDVLYRERNLAHHYNFFRRAELIIAYLMVNKDDTKQSVAGILYARTHKDDVCKNGSYDIKFGADKLGGEPKLKRDLYWDYTSGALGQYYLGSLINLNLVEVKEKFFCIKDKGLELARTYKERLPKTERDYFLELIEKGKVTLNDIDRISSFNICAIPFKGSEWEYLKKLLIEDDGENFQIDKDPSTKRRETNLLFLHFHNGYLRHCP